MFNIDKNMAITDVKTNTEYVETTDGPHDKPISYNKHTTEWTFEDGTKVIRTQEEFFGNFRKRKSPYTLKFVQPNGKTTTYSFSCKDPNKFIEAYLNHPDRSRFGVYNRYSDENNLYLQITSGLDL